MGEPAWDHETLRSWFLARAGEDVAETELLKAFFPDEDVFAGGMGLELFHKHFLLYRRLWLFDDELRTSTGHRLWIRGIRSTLIPPPTEGRCGWLNPETGLYCLAEASDGLCTGHSDLVPETNGMKAYYLDWKNLEGMTETALQELVNGFFRWMGNHEAIAQALETFGLEPTASPAAIKSQWRKLSLDHHPDRGGDPQLYQRYSAAWTVLKSLV